MTEPTIAEVRSLTDRYTRTVLAEPTGWERDLQASEDRAAPLMPAEIDADPVAAALLPPTLDEPRVYLERIGPSYKVVIRPLAARFLFRDVRTDRDLAADVTVTLEARHLFRTTVTLGSDRPAGWRAGRRAPLLAGRHDADGRAGRRWQVDDHARGRSQSRRRASGHPGHRADRRSAAHPVRRGRGPDRVLALAQHRGNLPRARH